MNNSKRIYRAAIYVRLSKEDGDLDDAVFGETLFVAFLVG